MSWYFKDIGSDDVHGVPVEGSPELHVLRRYYWGLNGETEVRSPPGKRQLTFELMIGTDGQNYDLPGVMARVLEIETYIGSHGEFAVFDPVDLGSVIIYPESTLDSVERVMQSPLQDIAGQATGNQDSWYQLIRLMFTQLVLDNTQYQ